jgi:hypothetical protein
MLARGTSFTGAATIKAELTQLTRNADVLYYLEGNKRIKEESSRAGTQPWLQL